MIYTNNSNDSNNNSSASASNVDQTGSRHLMPQVNGRCMQSGGKGGIKCHEGRNKVFKRGRTREGTARAQPYN
eukprot:363499-Chlamydomonas_euryale.AAC.7